MLQTQSFSVERAGIIKGGMASYTADLSTGAISYTAMINVGWAFITKTFKYEGTYQVDPNELKSRNLNEVGDIVNIADLGLMATNITGDIVTLNVAVSGKAMKGIAVGNISQDCISFSHLNANVEVSGFSLNIVLNCVG